MATHDFQVGEIVRYEIEGPVIGTGPNVVSIKLPNGPALVLSGGDLDRITRTSPAHWPPRPDDLWRDGHGKSWLAQMDSQTGEIFLIAMAGNGATIQYAFARLANEAGPLTLVHREQPDDGVSDE